MPQNKIEVIYNWCEEQVLKPEPPDMTLKESLRLNNRFNIIFAGNIGPAQGLDAVLSAAKMLASRAPNVQFVFIGGGVSVASLKEQAAAMGLPNVRFLQRRPMDEIGAVLNLADVLFVHLRKTPLFEITIPSKTQAYMAVGKPILMGVAGDAARLVHQAGAGLICEPENAESIVDAVVQLHAAPEKQRQKMGQNGRAFYQSQMSLSTSIDRFESMFRHQCCPRMSNNRNARLGRHRQSDFNLPVVPPSLTQPVQRFIKNLVAPDHS